jgi:hypothetical protein
MSVFSVYNTIALKAWVIRTPVAILVAVVLVRLYSPWTGMSY